MKKVLAVVLAAAFVGLTAYGVQAQTPNIQFYFDVNTTMASMDCPGSGGPVSGYVVAANLGVFFSSIDYSISYPPSMTWVADASVDPVNQLNIGTTPTGVASAWALPQNGFEPIKIMQVLFDWNCENLCADALPGGDPLVIQPYPGQTSIRYVRWPDNVVFEAVGMTSLVCPGAVPVEETNWGQVKALYGE
jgi:hypothetical protein